MITRKHKILFGCLLIVFLTEAVWLGFALFKKYFHPEKSYRILACVSSYKRPIFVSGQVLRLMNQTYPVDISLSVKGVPESFVRNVLQTEWQPFINQGRLKVRIDPNRDQFSNFLDTVRDVDISQYDFFCKVDDDDWYSPFYFEHVNKELNKEPNVGVSLTSKTWVVREGEKEVIVRHNPSRLSGPSMCFSRRVIEAALEIEKDPKASLKYTPQKNIDLFRNTREDNYLNTLGQNLGGMQFRDTPREDLVFGQQYPSVMRGNY